MHTPPDKLSKPETTFSAQNLDTSALVGHAVVIYSEQFPGRELQSRVLAAKGNAIEIDSGGNRVMIENLVHNQTVVLKFVHREQHVSIRAQLKRTGTGRAFLLLEEHVMPLTQRRFVRVPLIQPVRFAPIPKSAYTARALSQLRWMETDSVNFSAGGLLLAMPSHLEKSVTLLLNLEYPNDNFPALLLAQIRHCYHVEGGRYRAGIEFMVREMVERQLTPEWLKTFPATVLQYTSGARQMMNEELKRKSSGGQTE